MVVNQCITQGLTRLESLCVTRLLIVRRAWNQDAAAHPRPSWGHLGRRLITMWTSAISRPLSPSSFLLQSLRRSVGRGSRGRLLAIGSATSVPATWPVFALKCYHFLSHAPKQRIKMARSLYRSWKPCGRTYLKFLSLCNPFLLPQTGAW